MDSWDVPLRISSWINGRSFSAILLLTLEVKAGLTTSLHLSDSCMFGDCHADHLGHLIKYKVDVTSGQADLVYSSKYNQI